MLSPEKHMDLDKSTLMVTEIILKYMLRRKIAKVDDLFSFVEGKIGDGIHEVFLSSLTILYAFGKLNYFDQNDTITLVRK